MSETVSVTVPEAARRLGVSERTIWRRLRRGTLQARRDERRVLVELHDDHRVAEVAATYDAPPFDANPWSHPGPWPYTARLIERHRAALLERRRAAGREMDRLAADSRPDPDGWSAVDYIRADREGVDLDHAPRRRRQ